MFNSQMINNDPAPYIIDFGLALGTVRSSEDAGSHWDSHDTYYDPRPEFDNNPNPILIAFREEDELQRDSGDEGIPTLGTARYWIDTNQMGNETTEEEFTHAYKVLTRLVNIYGSEQ